ncbi:undecaprenyldiphospho-muramoylpentapeptide beta-N-acetylglucosaminyltransferase [Pseudomaricurvus alkylphenolicus]|uniref:undecaprenyldiphospho-muramoylpentapeptide beta-N-acetylglucosaminyltransferase n=1 Tax=Pseudomaricurvus alkylphenolicus TaxID=1306991 RepID=UPI001421BECF|nr:undecaprenyldiphospho-muramoylpentapeptide beta-N-acetylglucosaminyltransferase [Pseudomaricurvus alkylphenolicus]NIB40058.1 undecaprenyldiphospho-muramoylpentapeptide beta-N-acetylglucosaminyltransferase [Pseudomaricurvus alkylphenolicus]
MTTSANAPLNVVVMAGGTGGHVFPALSVAEELRERGARVRWLGTARGIEAELVPAANIDLHCLTIEGVRGKGALTKLKAPWLLLKAVWQARKVLKSEPVDVVLGLGGFASGPGGVAAWLMGVPLVVHEQNAVAGTTNRWLAKLTPHALEAFPGSLPKARHVGNPVRTSIGAIADLKVRQQRPLRLLVLGGSLGALALNELVPKALALLSAEQRPQVRHQTGKRHLQSAKDHYGAAGVDAEVVDFIEDMAAAYEWADVVVCRSGALTVSELTLAGRGALLVPFPFAIDDHQTLNARWLEQKGAARLCQQKELTPENLAEFIQEITSQPERCVAMGAAARSLAMPNAASDVADRCQQVAHG